MSDVQFDDNSFGVNRPINSALKKPPLISFLLKTGIVKDEQQANYLMIGVAITCLLLTVYVIKSSFF